MFSLIIMFITFFTHKDQSFFTHKDQSFYTHKDQTCENHFLFILTFCDKFFF